jgi:hypothetical protein
MAAAASVALLIALGAVGPATAQQGEDCLSPREIQEAVASGRIVTVDEAMSADGISERPLGQAKVCRGDGNLEYHVNVMDAYGEATPKILDAEGG